MNSFVQPFWFCWLVIISSANAVAQEYGIVDTIRVSKNQQRVQAYRDTIIIYENVPGKSSALAQGFSRLGKDAPWDSVELVSLPWGQLPMSGCVLAGVKEYSGSTEKYGLHWILRDARTAKIDTTGRTGDPIDFRPVKRIRVHPANPKKVYLQYEYTTGGGIISATFVTNDDGKTWKEINPPSLGGDGGRGHTLGFNYQYPNRVYISVNPQSRVSPDAPYRAYYTDDDGETIIQGEYPLINGYGVGIWSKNGGLSYYSLDGKVQPSLYSDSLGLQSGESPREISLNWLETVKTMLLPAYDKATQRLEYSIDYAGLAEGYISGLAFHPESPKTFAVRFRLDTLIGNKWYSRSFIAATRDMGQSWGWVVPVHSLDSIVGNVLGSLIVDPKEDVIYCSYQMADYDSLEGRPIYLNSYTIKSTPIPTSVTDSKKLNSSNGLVVFPNPVCVGTPITVYINNLKESLNTSDIIVNVSTINGEEIIIDIDSSGHISTEHLIPGVYSLQIKTKHAIQHQLIVVTR